MMKLFQDARDYQILFLTGFLILGVFGRDFTLHLHLMAAVVAAGLITQYVLARGTSLKSAWITVLSLCLLLRANSLRTMILAGVISILCKFVFRYRGKHFFNPSNFGMIAVLTLTSDAWVTPGQWGEELWYAFLFLGAGAMVVRKVGRWDTTGAFLLCYFGLEAARNTWLGWTWDVYLHRMTSGALLLFSFFMITDPRSIPDNRRARVVWAALVAGLTFVLRNKFFMPTAVFWSLFLLSPFTIVLDRWLPAKRFEWTGIVPSRVKGRLVA